MLAVSQTYENIINSGSYMVECRLLVEASDNTMKEVPETELFSMRIAEHMLDKQFAIGGAVAAEISVTMIDPVDWSMPRMAKLQPQFRVFNGTDISEWLPKGVFYIDTRERTKSVNGGNKITIHGFDAMLMSEQEYPVVEWDTATDTEVLEEICENLGWTLDDDTAAFFGTERAGYTLPMPVKYSYREVLQSIATVNCGNFVMDEYGHLRLVRFNALPTETYYLIDQNENKITIGGDHIVLQ